MAIDCVCIYTYNYIILYVIIITQRAKQLFIASSFSVVGMTHSAHIQTQNECYYLCIHVQQPGLTASFETTYRHTHMF